ncbi:Planctomycete cytochrome C [Planctomycetes bacterium Pla163]|uniref:Planctomycete cytochrome C n=1 Tax=Rohdeia mirabilis TaxID=2528008 RepID=A0A518CZ02_9BACT|nr:Planctomycete cytochrome C [Planctomycetes bacterium Pla163]
MISSTFALAETARPLAEALPELFGRLHPVTIHFPIALLLMAAVFEGLNALRGDAGLRRAAVLCLWFGTLGALVAGGTGWVHESLEPSREPDVELHRWLGVAAAAFALLTSVVAVVALGARKGARSVRLFRAGLVITAVLTGGTGKIGGEMVWGADWYSRPFEARPALSIPPIQLPPIGLDGSGAGVSAPSSPSDPGPITYLGHVEPVLARHCYECHGPTGKADGDLRFSELAKAQEIYFGFDWEALIAPGSPDDSALYGVLVLPRDHDLAMPPKAEGEMSADEIERVRRWIAEGSTLEAMLR